MINYTLLENQINNKNLYAKFQISIRWVVKKMLNNTIINNSHINAYTINTNKA